MASILDEYEDSQNILQSSQQHGRLASVNIGITHSGRSLRTTSSGLVLVLNVLTDPTSCWRLRECKTRGGEADLQQTEDWFHPPWEDQSPGCVQQPAVHESGEGNPAQVTPTNAWCSQLWSDSKQTILTSDLPFLTVVLVRLGHGYPTGVGGLHGDSEWTWISWVCMRNHKLSKGTSTCWQMHSMHSLTPAPFHSIPFYLKIPFPDSMSQYGLSVYGKYVCLWLAPIMSKMLRHVVNEPLHFLISLFLLLKMVWNQSTRQSLTISMFGGEFVGSSVHICLQPFSGYHRFNVRQYFHWPVRGWSGCLIIFL